MKNTYTLDSHVAYSMKRYGTMTVEDRAIPDFRDGLKPVHRRILWAMLNERVHSNTGYKKSARIVGQVMGKYHPHGDMAIYQSMVTIANTPTKLIDGSGNWGWFNDMAGASRYTECRLSKYADFVMLAPEYISIIEKVPNYDGSEEEPLFLPSLFPTIFMLGIQGIAMAVVTNIPAFEMKGLVKLVQIGMEKGKISLKDCVKHLKFVYEYGGKVVSSEEVISEFFNSGQGKIEWECDYDVREKDNQIIIRGMPPYWNYSSKRDAFLKLDAVHSVVDKSNQEGIKIVVQVKQNIGHNGFVDVFENKIKPLLRSSAPYKINITKRHIKGEDILETGAEFFESSVLGVLNEWLTWRIELEKKAVKNIIQELDARLEKEELMKKAIVNLQLIFELLKKRGIDKVEVLAKKLNISTEDSKYIWSIAVGRLDKLSMDKVEKEIQEIQSDIKQNKHYYKNPTERIIKNLPSLTKKLGLSV
jgi:DNA gyrase subunit A